MVKKNSTVMNEKLGNLIEDIEIMQKKLINSKTENEISN